MPCTKQGGANASAFSPGELQSIDNIVRIPMLLHEAINSIYSSETRDGTARGASLRQRLRGNDFSKQYAQGLMVMRDLGIIRE
jgi:hypothetical protein